MVKPSDTSSPGKAPAKKSGRKRASVDDNVIVPAIAEKRSKKNISSNAPSDVETKVEVDTEQKPIITGGDGLKK